MKDKYSITKKWEAKIEEMRRKADFKYTVLLKNKKNKYELGWEHEIEKLERKKLSEIRKKEERMKRKMLNEIRLLEGKPKREYKTDAPKLKPMEFALKLAQENSRLRDTDKDGNGTCISCSFRGGRADFAGGHRYSRRFKGICLEPENINAQCHTCNFTTGPRGDTIAKEKVNAEYDRKLDIKFGKGTAQGLKDKLTAYMHGKYEAYDLDLEIPRLIEENEKLLETKNFYAPAKKWRATWIKWKNRS